MIYAIYSTGDSFGSYEDNGFELMIINRDKSIATENLNILKNAGDHSVNLYLDDLTEMSVYVPWNGYFESLSTLDMMECQIQGIN